MSPFTAHRSGSGKRKKGGAATDRSQERSSTRGTVRGRAIGQAARRWRCPTVPSLRTAPPISLPSLNAAFAVARRCAMTRSKHRRSAFCWSPIDRAEPSVSHASKQTDRLADGKERSRGLCECVSDARRSGLRSPCSAPPPQWARLESLRCLCATAAVAGLLPAGKVFPGHCAASHFIACDALRSDSCHLRAKSADWTHRRLLDRFCRTAPRSTADSLRPSCRPTATQHGGGEPIAALSCAHLCYY